MSCQGLYRHLPSAPSHKHARDINIPFPYTLRSSKFYMKYHHSKSWYKWEMNPLPMGPMGWQQDWVPNRAIQYFISVAWVLFSTFCTASFLKWAKWSSSRASFSQPVCLVRGWFPLIIAHRMPWHAFEQNEQKGTNISAIKWHNAIIDQKRHWRMFFFSLGPWSGCYA